MLSSFVLSVCYEQVTTTTTTTTSSSIPINYDNASIPTDADNTSSFDVSMASCSGCDHTMTRFSVSNGQAYDDDKSLSTGEIQSLVSAGQMSSGSFCQIVDNVQSQCVSCIKMKSVVQSNYRRYANEK